jgi:hypothetical protein
MLLFTFQDVPIHDKKSFHFLLTLHFAHLIFSNKHHQTNPPSKRVGLEIESRQVEKFGHADKR